MSSGSAMFAFLLEAVLISLSGVMAPGPITAVAVGKGSESPHAGALVAIGHAVVEVPLMIAVFYGVGQLLSLTYVKVGIALVGGVFLAFMGVGMLRAVRRQELSPAVSAPASARSPLLAGILLSLGNPYFLVWWATVGAALIVRSVRFGILGFVALALCHWLCDLAWDYFLSALSFRGRRFLGQGFQRAVFGLCGLALFFFSGRLVFSAVKELGWSLAV